MFHFIFSAFLYLIYHIFPRRLRAKSTQLNLSTHLKCYGTVCSRLFLPHLELSLNVCSFYIQYLKMYSHFTVKHFIAFHFSDKREKNSLARFFLSFIFLLPLSIWCCQFFSLFMMIFFLHQRQNWTTSQFEFQFQTLSLHLAINKKCESKKRKEHNICAIFQLNSSFQFIPKEEKKKYNEENVSPRHCFYVNILLIYTFVTLFVFFMKYFCLSEWFLHPDL